MLIWSEQELLLIVSSSMLKRQPYTVYRVVLNNETKLVHVISFGMERVDVSPEQVYDSINDLPEWMQEGIALLMMMSDERGQECAYHKGGRTVRVRVRVGVAESFYVRYG